MSKCNHIIGISVMTIRDREGRQISEIKTDVLSSDFKDFDKGFVNVDWAGPRYSFCPLCGHEIGKLGLKPEFEDK